MLRERHKRSKFEANLFTERSSIKYFQNAMRNFQWNWTTCWCWWQTWTRHNNWIRVISKLYTIRIQWICVLTIDWNSFETKRNKTKQIGLHIVFFSAIAVIVAAAAETSFIWIDLLQLHQWWYAGGKCKCYKINFTN